MNNKKFAKIFSIVLVAVLILSFIIPAFSMAASAEEGNSTAQNSPSPSPSASVTPSPSPSPSEQPTASPTPEDPSDIIPSTEYVFIDSSKDVFIQNYVLLDMAGNELTSVSPGQRIKIAVSVVDNRVTYWGTPYIQVRARMAQGAFINNNVNDISTKFVNIGTNSKGENILSYTVVFQDVTYQGGTGDLSFDVSYIDQSKGYDVSLAVPYKLLTQNISQAVDNIPEPKVVLNSANYGGVAYIGKNFTLSTSATNASQYVDLENVTVRVELPSGLAMASGNSQVLIGKVAKSGAINHNFELVVTGVESTVTSLPVNIIYEFEAYVKGERKTYTSQQSIAINVEQETKFEISKLQHMEMANAMEETYVTVYMVNKGKTAVNNVTIEMESDATDGVQTVFVGNVQPGTESSSDVYFTVQNPGSMKGKIKVTYEDTKGKQSTLEKEFTMEISEAYVPDFNMPVDVPMETEEGGFPWIAVIAVIVVAGGVAAFIIIKKRKAKKLAEDEDEDI